ncbi:MAG: hypothetical protein ACHQM6_00915 [Candidatus Kapaibacterium sp.]
MFHYEDQITLSEGLLQYLMHYNLGDGGYTDRFFKINFFWKITLMLPNISGRVNAVKFHDLHHVLTEYGTGLCGEAEIGAWEIASGCGKYWAAWLLNFGSITYGIFLFPKAVFKAFIRGRHCGNLYHGKDYERILDTSVGDMRNELHIGRRQPTARATDILVLIFWVLLALLYIAVAVFAGISIIKYLLKIF